MMLRKKMCQLIFIIGLLSLPCIAQAEGQIPGGGFENGTVDWNCYNSWGNSPGFSFSLNSDANYVYEGTKSLKLVSGFLAKGNKQHIISNSQNYVTLYKDKTYNVTVWYYPTSPVSVTLASYVAGVNDVNKRALTPNQWNKVVFSFTAPRDVGPGFANKVQFLFEFHAENEDIQSGSIIYMDNALLGLSGEIVYNPTVTATMFSSEGNKTLSEVFSTTNTIMLPWANSIVFTLDKDTKQSFSGKLICSVYDSENTYLKDVAIADISSGRVEINECNLELGDIIKLFAVNDNNLSPYGKVMKLEQGREYRKTFDSGTEGFYAERDTSLLEQYQNDSDNVLKFVPKSSENTSIFLDISTLPRKKDYICFFAAAYSQGTNGKHTVSVLYQAEDESLIEKQVYTCEKRQNLTYDIEAQFDIHSQIIKDGKTYYPQSCKITASGNSESIILIDDFTIVERINDDDVPALKDVLGGYFDVGTAFTYSRLSNTNAFLPMVKKHYNIVTAEDTMLLSNVFDGSGGANFEKADKLMDYCYDNGLKLIGHCLIWEHNMQSLFLSEIKKISDPVLRKEKALEKMESMIKTYMLRYGNKIKGWDVVNEAASSTAGSVYYNVGLWAEVVGEDYVEYAFRYAQQAADLIEAQTGQKVELYYNDYGINSKARRENIFKIVKNLLDKGLRVDGVGIQSHFDTSYDIDSIIEGYEYMKGLGILINISELDVSVYPASVKINLYERCLPSDVEKKQTDMYKKLFDYYKANSSFIGRVTTWGMTDKHSYRHAANQFMKRDYPLLFDKYFQPKPAFWAVID